METTQEKTFTETQILAFFARLVITGCFKTDRDFEIAKKLLTSHLGLVYQESDWFYVEEELKRVIHKESLNKS